MKQVFKENRRNQKVLGGTRQNTQAKYTKSKCIGALLSSAGHSVISLLRSSRITRQPSQPNPPNKQGPAVQTGEACDRLPHEVNPDVFPLSGRTCVFTQSPMRGQLSASVISFSTATTALSAMCCYNHPQLSQIHRGTDGEGVRITSCDSSWCPGVICSGGAVGVYAIIQMKLQLLQK